MSQLSHGAPTAGPEREGPTPPPPPGPIAQSVAIGFRAVYVAMGLLALVWLLGNVRQISPDTQAVVLRFGRVVGAQQAGLLLAWPRPIDQIQLLPGPERQLSQVVGALAPESDRARAVILGNESDRTMPQSVSPYLTGDGNVVLLSATLVYRITDPLAFSLAETHVPAALDRLFRATTVHTAAQYSLNDFLVVQTGGGIAASGNAPTPLRAEVRNTLLETMNARLRESSAVGARLGVEIDRIDMTAWLPPDAKMAFDSVLVATQAADRGVALARTDAEHRRQDAERERDRLLSGAQASARELTSTASVQTLEIRALERESTVQSHAAVLQRVFRQKAADIIGRAGSVTVIDPQSGVRFVLPGHQR